MLNQERLIKERNFYDARATLIEINSEAAQRLYSFDSPVASLGARLPRLKQTLLQSIGNPKGKRVLVYGCGNDNAAIWFSKSGASVDAIDISPKSVENQQLLADMLELNINPMVMDCHNLNLPSSEYDVVYGNAILHHLDRAKALPEIGRVLKPSGKAIFRDVMKGNVFLRLFRFATPAWRTSDEIPLSYTDYVLFNQCFSNVQKEEYILSGLPYIFFIRIANKAVLEKMGIRYRLPLSNSAYTIFDSLDHALFKMAPILRNQAWLCLVVLSK